MNIQIIFCHPSKESYTREILEILKTYLEEENLAYEVRDLYALEFKTDMSLEEYQREGFANLSLPIPDDIKVEQNKLAKANIVIFLYPVWWSDCPAKLKGWFDRVYTVGYAYGNDTVDEADKWKPINKGIVICTAGHPNEFLEEIGIAQSMKTVMLDDRLGKRFLKKEMLILGGTIDKELVKLKHKQRIKFMVSQLYI